MTATRILIIYKHKGTGTGRMITAMSQYAAHHGRWKITLCERPDAEAGVIETWRPDGILATHPPTPEAVRIFRARQTPVVGCGLGPLPADVPCVRSNPAGCGQMAAACLLGRGFSQLAFLGKQQAPGVSAMAQTFARTGAQGGASCEIRLEPRLPLRRPRIERYFDQMAAWLRSLPKPVGLMIASDLLGQRVIQACDMAGLHVPQDIAVIAVGNNEDRCSFTVPALSSIDPDSERMGLEAARLLHRMLDGCQVPPTDLLIPPRGVVERASSDMIAVQDPVVAAAVRLIRAQCPFPVKVSQLARDVGVCRRRLERCFRETLGITPAEAVRHHRMERVRELLRTTDLPVQEVAGLCGFPHARELWRRFQKQFATNPRDYRNKHRTASPSRP